MTGIGLEAKPGRVEQGEAAASLGQATSIVDPASPAAEAFRTLRTNLLYAFVDEPPKVILVTSSGPGEGKSTACANLSVSLAQAQKTVLVLDCDLRKPALHKMFGLRNLRGLLEILAGELRLEDVWEEPLPGLKVVTVGTVPPNPSELLGSRRFAGFLEQARLKFDYVLLDTPPVGLVSDPLILSAQADGILLVVDAKGTRKGSVRNSVRSLEAVGAKILGTVVNKFKTVGRGRYGYGNYGY